MMGEPFGPRSRASRRANLRCLALSASIAFALAGCTKQDDSLAWYDQPNDPQVYALVLDRCLNSTRGPQQTQYNDWDEAIQECGRQAQSVSRYCPKGAQCHGGAVSREDVRRVLGETPKGGAA